MISNSECESSYGKSDITKNMMCAKGENGQDACRGDSGGASQKRSRGIKIRH